MAPPGAGVRTLPRLLREPLLHFFLVGAGLFALFAWLRGPIVATPERIHVDAARIEQLALGFRRTWQRPPAQDELDGLVAEFVREEILYREALAIGLDRDDTIVRRRMRQKLEFLSEDVAAVEDPDDATLSRYLAQHADAYRVEPLVALRQIFFSPDRRGDAASLDAQAALARLGADPAADETGDASLLPQRLPPTTLSGISRVFGDAFAEQIGELTAGSWAGPIESSFGLHLVFIETREAGRAPSLDEVRQAVRNDWQAAQRSEANEVFYQRLRERYEVTIEAAGEPPS
jgi:hypothetical protein